MVQDIRLVSDSSHTLTMLRNHFHTVWVKLHDYLSETKKKLN